MTAFAFRPFPERLREESVQQGIGKKQEKEDRNKYLVYNYHLGNRACCCNFIYFEAPFSQLHSILHTHRASMQTYSLPLPIHPSTRTHYDTCSTLGRDRYMVFLKQKVVRSWARQRAISQDNSTRWWWALNVSLSRDSQQTVAYTIRCAHRTWRCSCHSLEVAVKLSRLSAIEDSTGLIWK